MKKDFGRLNRRQENQDESDPVRAKKHLGQHFLKDEHIAREITALPKGNYKILLEIGPGTGILTQYLVKTTPYDLWMVEIDAESVTYLHKHYPQLADQIILGDFLDWDLSAKFPDPIGIIGNFPYNISSQIFFKVLDHINRVEEVVCMLQKEVAVRLCSKPGNKDYGILSVLLQTWYYLEYCFTVDEHVFSPPPKVKSGVIRLKRNKRETLPISESFYKHVIKQGFNNRRKTLRNALKGLNLAPEVWAKAEIQHWLDLRAEQLGVEDFIQLAINLEPFLLVQPKKSKTSMPD